MSVSDVHSVFLEMELKLKANKNGKNPRTKHNLRNIIRTKCVFIASLAIKKKKKNHFTFLRVPQPEFALFTQRIICTSQRSFYFALLHI